MIDPRITEWIKNGCPGAGDFCLHIPSFILLNFLQRKKLDSMITFLISDMVLQIKGGDKPTVDEIKAVCDVLINRGNEAVPVPEPKAKPKSKTKEPSILSLPKRKK
jgi:hypothetical protein